MTAPIPAPPMPRVQRRLPAGGIDALIQRPWEPLINAVFRTDHHGQQPNGPSFPLQMIALAPNVPAFLASLGRPLGIASDLEASPGVWWLVTDGGEHEYIIFSDSHRKNAWKGGQLCLASSSPEPLSTHHPAIQAIRAGFEQVWGLPVLPAPGCVPGLLDDLMWFEDRLRLGRGVEWPRAPAPVKPRPPRG